MRYEDFFLYTFLVAPCLGLFIAMVYHECIPREREIQETTGQIVERIHSVEPLEIAQQIDLPDPNVPIQTAESFDENDHVLIYV